MIWDKYIFLMALCGSIYFMKEMFRIGVSQDLKADIARKKEQRQRRKAALR